ncbi:MAG TPA: AraC family transcriptional regulator ligand-binding domain-containing protein [Amphiplicatus sp.]|nr:AraC family transcriptional regulator ligand-binding domain-containing protein [Amphiplicatus sp.]
MGDVSCRYLKSYFDTCIAQGCPPEPLIELLNAGPAPFENPARRFDNSLVIDMLHLAESLTGETTMGLFAGRGFRPATFLDIGLALVSSATLRQALEINERYQDLTQQLGKTHLVVKSDKALITWRSYIDDPERMRPVTEAVFAGYAVFGRWLTWLYDQEVAAMRFRHSRPPHAAECDELFGCKVTYHARVNEMELDPTLVDMPLPNANPELLQVLCARLDRELAALRKPLTAEAETFHCVQAMLGDGAPSLERVARALDTSERTLRRRLAEEGASFRGVVESARKEACEVYIRERRKSIAEIAHALGYSEQSAFTRAFRNWFGASPSEYIRAL